MKWVTWENVGIDRIGCAWLIRKRIDAKAKFLFVPAESQPLPIRRGTLRYSGARLSHHQGHCSFYALLREYKLDDPVLHKIARIIDEADTVQEVHVEPAAPGLDLICQGIRLTSPDDAAAVERGALVYEALYAKLAMETIDQNSARSHSST